MPLTRPRVHPLLLLAAVPVFSHAAPAVLRIACDGPDAGAEVFIDGKFKGECPVDIMVEPGTIRVRAVKSAGGTRERVFEQTLRVAEGTSKRLNLELGAAQLTEQGRLIEAENQRRQRAQAERQAQEKAQEELREARARQAEADVTVSAWLAAARTVLPSNIPDCPDCPGLIKPAGGVTLDTPPAMEQYMNGWLGLARNEATSYLSTNGQGFRPPAVARPMPCEGAEEAMKELAGLNFPADQSGEASRKYRASMQAYSGTFVYARDVQLWPEQASCETGRLHGPLDFWAAGTVVSGSNYGEYAATSLKRVRATMVNGQASSPVIVSARTRTLIKPPERADLRSDTLVVSVSDVPVDLPTRRVVLILSQHEDPQMHKAMATAKTLFTIPKPEGRSEELHYDGTRLSARTQKKNGIAHGQTTIYGYKVKTGTLAPDYEVPTTRQCYQEGKQVQLDPCPAN